MPFGKRMHRPPFGVLTLGRIKIWLWGAICFLFFHLLPAWLFAGEKTVKWGHIPIADLEMTEFPEDTNAAAVILADIGDVSYDGRFNVVLTRHRRIKILSPAGYRWGTFAIDFCVKDRAQWITDLEGQTFNLAADGTIKCDKLDPKAIFDEKVDDENHRLRFTLPALAPGAVVEYRYRMHSSRGAALREWEFQTSEPTRWSEFRADIPEAWQYLIVKQGDFAFAVNETQSYLRPFTLAQGITTKRLDLQTVSHRWAMRQVPALRDEPLMANPNDIRAKLRFHLLKIALPDQPEINVTSTWEALAELLMESDGFGRQINDQECLRRQTASLITGLSDPEQKIRTIYDYVRRTMNWTGEYEQPTNIDLNKAFQTRRASGPEIAAMLTGMLRCAGFEANPVLVSTREHGKVLQDYPALSQFNHALTHVKVGRREYLFDATDPLRPHDLLPVSALNEVGWLVNKSQPRWISLAPSGYFSSQVTVSAELAPNGVITGWFESRDEGYSSLFDRHTLRYKKTEEYIKEKWLADLASAQLHDFTISNRDSIHAPLLATVHFSSDAHAQVAGDLIYLNPIFFRRRKENPLKPQEYTYPIDFGYGFSLVYTMYLSLPEGYELQELPKNIAVSVPSEDGQFQRLAHVEKNTLQLTSQMVIRKPRFAPEEYQGLRELYDWVVAAHAEPIVFKRAAAPEVKKN